MVPLPAVLKIRVITVAFGALNHASLRTKLPCIMISYYRVLSEVPWSVHAGQLNDQQPSHPPSDQLVCFIAQRCVACTAMKVTGPRFLPSGVCITPSASGCRHAPTRPGDVSTCCACWLGIRVGTRPSEPSEAQFPSFRPAGR